MDGLIIWLMLVILMSSSTFSLLAPFYPDMAETKKGLSSGMVGLVLSSFSITYVIASYLVGRYLSKMGRRFSLYTGIIMQGVSMIGFGALIWISNKTFFIILSFTFRMLGGVACAFVWVSCYAMTSIKYPDEIQQKISLLEAANGAGLFIGPLLGGLIYQFTSFWTPFFLFTALSFVMIPFMLKKFTAELDKDDSANQSSERIGFFKLLKNKRVSFAALAQFFNILMFTVGQPVFGPRLTHDYGLSSFWVGACFAIPTIFYILTGPIFLPLLTKGFEKRATMMVGFFILTVAAFLVGPSGILGFPKESAPLMIIGLGVLGTGAAFTVIPVIPEMLDAVKDEYEGQQTELSDNFSAIFNIAGGFGQIVGPSTAGLLNDQVGFNFTFDIIGGLVLAFNILYILWCGGFGSLGRSFRARIVTCRKKKEVGSDSPTHHLLNEETETQDELNSSGSDSPKATRKGDEEAPESADISTDTSLIQDTIYAIN